jgi:hypothetical protein
MAEAAVRAVLVVVVLVACSSGQPDGPAAGMNPDAWPRCYALRTGDWAPPSGQKLDVTHAPPPVVQLDTQQVDHGVEKRNRLGPNIPALGQRGLAPSWTHLGPDTLQLLWSSGYEGVFVTVGVRGDSVSGSARTFTDYGSETLARVTGWRTACPPERSPS